MSDTFERITRLVTDRSVRISDHGYDELVADDISTRDVIDASAMGEWSKIIQTIPKVLVCRYYSQTGMEIQFMCCGASRRDTQNRRLLSPLTYQIHPNGRTDS